MTWQSSRGSSPEFPRSRGLWQAFGIPCSRNLLSVRHQDRSEPSRAHFGDPLHGRLEGVMNSISNGLGMRETEIAREPIRPWNPHFYAISAQVHNTLKRKVCAPSTSAPLKAWASERGIDWTYCG